jgi:hypothetical protein
MKRLLLFTIIVKFNSIISFSQPNYSDYAINNKEKVFFDDFLDDRNSWGLGYQLNNSIFSQIKYGYFQAKVYDKINSKNKTHSVPFSQNKDWEIETQLKYIEGDETNGFAILWGLENTENKGYHFWISGNGQYAISKRDTSGARSFYINWTSSMFINKFEWNKLTIRKVDNSYDFFINEKYVYSIPFESFYGNEVGFTIGPNMTVRVDYLHISYLNKPIK